MKRLKWFGMLLTLCLTTACAPAVYGVAYHNQNPRVVRHVIMPIEVMMYADNNYRSRHFETVRLVIADGQYVAIPVKDRRGRHTQIYAHYHQRNLHLDMDRNCRGLEGSSQFKYDKSWERGHHYTNIAAGSRYDLKGLRLMVRVASQDELHSSSTFENRDSTQNGPRNNKTNNSRIEKSNRKISHQTIKKMNTGHTSPDRQRIVTERSQRDQKIAKPHIIKKIRQVEKQKERIKGKKVLRSKQSRPDVLVVSEDVHEQQQAVSQKISTKHHGKNE